MENIVTRITQLSDLENAIISLDIQMKKLFDRFNNLEAYLKRCMEENKKYLKACRDGYLDTVEGIKQQIEETQDLSNTVSLQGWGGC